ncbi:MAG: hypothetical protein ABEJ79_07600 [Halolamina sp.]
MEIDAEMRRKVVASLAAVLTFVAAVLTVGASFNSEGLTATGGYALVGAIGLFVVLMAGVGVVLDRS